MSVEKLNVGKIYLQVFYHQFYRQIFWLHLQTLLCLVKFIIQYVYKHKALLSHFFKRICSVLFVSYVTFDLTHLREQRLIKCQIIFDLGIIKLFLELTRLTFRFGYLSIHVFDEIIIDHEGNERVFYNMYGVIFMPTCIAINNFTIFEQKHDCLKDFYISFEMGNTTRYAYLTTDRIIKDEATLTEKVERTRMYFSQSKLFVEMECGDKLRT